MSEDSFVLNSEVRVFADYTGGAEAFVVRIVPLSTHRFPYGIELCERFVGDDRRARAEGFAVAVREYLEKWLKAQHGK